MPEDKAICSKSLWVEPPQNSGWEHNNVVVYINLAPTFIDVLSSVWNERQYWRVSSIFPVSFYVALVGERYLYW